MSLWTRAYVPLVVSAWAGLMGYQAYDGFMRPATAPDDSTALIEPWESHYELEWQGRRCGFLTERFEAARTGGGWIRDSAVFVSEKAFGAAVIGNASVQLAVDGVLQRVELRVDSLVGTAKVHGVREQESLRLDVLRNGQPFLDGVSVPAPRVTALHLEMPLLGLENLGSSASQDVRLPEAPGMPFRDIRLNVEPGTLEGGETDESDGRVVRISTEDNWIRLKLSLRGRLRLLTSSSGFSMVAAPGAIVRRYTAERKSLIERLAGQAAEVSP